MSTATVTCASISGAARGTKAAEEFKIDPCRFRLIAEPVLPLTGDTLMSEVKRNVWTEVLPDGMRRAPLVFITRWVIHKDNHDKLAEHVTGSIGSWGMDAQQTHPDRLFYSRTRHFFRPRKPTKGPGLSTPITP